MAVDGFGDGPRDHAALTGLTVGDPHPQYAYDAQGLDAEKPAQPVRLGYRYFATDTLKEYRSDGSSWHPVVDTSDLLPRAGGSLTGALGIGGAAGTGRIAPLIGSKNGDDLPSSYRDGLTYAVGTSTGWPTTSASIIVTHKYSNTRILQDYSTIAADGRQMGHWRRYGYVVTVDTNEVWSPWTDLVGDTSWKVPSLTSAATNYGAGYNPAGYRKDSAGFVQLRGLLNITGSGAHVFTLPVGYRPAYQMLLAAIASTAGTSGSIPRCDVYPDGRILCFASAGWFSLDNLSFYAEA